MPGDEVLVPRPSYPLFEHLTRLDGVVARPVRPRVSRAWAIDSASVERACSERTRAVLWSARTTRPARSSRRTSSTGSPRSAPRRDAAIIADEVFADYELVERRRRRGGTCCCAPRRAGVQSGRALEVGRPATGEAGMDGGGRTRRDCRRGARPPRARLRYVSVGVDAGAGGRRRNCWSAARSCGEQIRARVTANYRELHRPRRRRAGVPAAAQPRADGTP